MRTGLSCQILDWDSEFFGRRIARVVGKEMDSEKMESVQAFARSQNVDCVYFLVDDEDEASIRAAEAGDFRCVDVRVTRERTLEGISKELPAGVKVFRDEDLAALQAIARSSHSATRFYHDAHFSRQRCDSLYERWITNSCGGESDRVFVVRRNGEAVAYLTCEVDSSKVGQIGLVAVSESERGRRLGEDLVRSSLAWFAKRDRERVRVISQARNVAAAKLYEKLGFDTTATERWFHFWPDAASRA